MAVLDGQGCMYVYRMERAMRVGGHALEDNDSRWCGLEKTESKQAWVQYEERGGRWVKHEERGGRHPDARYKYKSTKRAGSSLAAERGRPRFEPFACRKKCGRKSR
jgi:hypothetical protein